MAFAILFYVVGIVVAVAFISGKFGDSRPGSETPEPPEWAKWIVAKESPLSAREWKLYGILDEWARANGFRVLANLNLYALLRSKGAYGPAAAAWRKIQAKQVDFACVDASGRTLFCVELDDGAHDTESGRKRDSDKDAAFAAAGIPLHRTRSCDRLPECAAQYGAPAPADNGNQG